MTIVMTIVLSMVLAVVAPAHAQVLGLPRVQVPGVGLPSVPSTLPMRQLDSLVRDPLAVTRQLRIDALLRGERKRVDIDPQGAPILRGHYLALDLAQTQREAVLAAGFVVDRPSQPSLPGLDVVVLRDTRARRTATAMRALKQAAPAVVFTYEHLYLPAGGEATVARDTPAGQPAAPGSRRIGLVDGGVDADDPALANARINHHGCSAPSASSTHGTAVAARLVGGDADTLYAADLWCGGAVGGATSKLVDALAWMARERVPVVNISLVGPDNPVLARAVRTMIERGHVLVSAVGNDGPAAPPLFPAAYPGVIGVSGVDGNDRVLPESGRGEHVDFSASGVTGHGRSALRGTSFAAPIVARRAAQLIHEPREGAAAQVQRQLAREARDLGNPGRDPRYGEGLITP